MVGEGGVFYLFVCLNFIYFIMACVSMLSVILLLLNVSVYVYLIVLCELLVCMND